MKIYRYIKYQSLSKWFFDQFHRSNKGLMHIIFQYIGPHSKADVSSDKLSEQVKNRVIL